MTRRKPAKIHKQPRDTQESNSGDGKERVHLAPIGAKGVVVLPARLRRRVGLDEGNLALIEEHEDGLLLRAATAQLFADRAMAKIAPNRTGID